MITATSINAIGNVCQQVARSYAAVQAAIEDLGIRPALVINTVPHYSDDDVELIRQHLQTTEQAK